MSAGPPSPRATSGTGQGSSGGGGGGGNTVSVQNLPSANVQIDTGGGSVEPVYVESIEAENEGEMSSIQDQCGNLETRRVGSRNWSITIEGLLLDTQVQPIANVTNAEEMFLTSNLYTGPVELRNTILRQSHDIVSIVVGQEAHMAFGFQLQLREPEPAQ